MIPGNSQFIYVGMLAFVVIITVMPYLFYTEPSSPAQCIQKVIDYCQKLEILEKELSTLLKQDVYQELIQNDLEPAEDLLAKENHEIQMYLREFSPTDMLILQDYEDSAETVSKILTTIPQHIKLAMENKFSRRSDLENKKHQLLQDFPSFQAEISNLEELRIYLNRGTSIEQSSGMVTGITGLEILVQIKGYFEDLEKLNDKIKVIGKHYIPESKDSDQVSRGTSIESIVNKMNDTERKLREVVYKERLLLGFVYPNSEASITRIQEYVSVLQHKDTFWYNEWKQRLNDLTKQYNMFCNSIDQLKLNYHQRTQRRQGFVSDF